MSSSSFVFDLECHVPRCHDGCEIVTGPRGSVSGFACSRRCRPVPGQLSSRRRLVDRAAVILRGTRWVLHPVDRGGQLSLAREVGSQSPLQLLLLLALGGHVRIRPCPRSPDGKDHARRVGPPQSIDVCIRPWRLFPREGPLITSRRQPAAGLPRSLLCPNASVSLPTVHLSNHHPQQQ